MHTACPLAEIGALPAPRVVLVVAPDAAIGSIQQQGVVDILPIAEQQRAGQMNAQAGTGLFHPLSGLPIGRFGQRKVFIAIGITCVEKFRQDHELCAGLGCLRDQPFGARQPLRHRRGGGIKLRGGNRDSFVHDNFSVVLNLPRVDFAESAAKRRVILLMPFYLAARYFHYSIFCIQSFVSSAFTARSASWISLFKLCLRLNGALGGK